MFLGIPDPDLLVRCTDPVPTPNASLSQKGVEQNKIMLAKYNFNTKF
jgi:hypothetical protein